MGCIDYDKCKSRISNGKNMLMEWEGTSCALTSQDLSLLTINGHNQRHASQQYDLVLTIKSGDYQLTNPFARLSFLVMDTTSRRMSTVTIVFNHVLFV